MTERIEKMRKRREYPTLKLQCQGLTKFLMVFLISISFDLPSGLLRAQEKFDQIRILDSGMMVWDSNGMEVKGFGVNYTVPFAYAFRNGKKLEVDLKAAIDQDVYQFARLGLDLFRVHVWDCEISDTLGNLLQNEHLDLFDYLLYRLKEHHINAIITPIAYWGNGWPEPDEWTPGFSHKYGKAGCLINPDAIRAQENYLRQFANHVNPYLKKAYKNEPMILAFEICNEPHHENKPEEVTAFVRRMKDAVRQTGCTKPVFYNVSHKILLAEDYFNAGIDGGTFQWYPTGLGYQKELGGNMLPNVDRYTIPFDDVMKKNHAARIVYEFDAADVARSYMYPAMARSFRTAGIQLATQFAYDPTFLAPYNTEYNTHYLNLLYTPQKALSLMIAGEVFRTIPMYTDFGVYPANTSFGPFRVSYEHNLSEMVTDAKFIYSNATSTIPPSPAKLELIAGYGNSSLVEYEGTGAYFLDKVGDEIWRLELMPDVMQVHNIFGRNSLEQTVAVLKQDRHSMKFRLPGFEHGFSVESVDWKDSIIYRETKNKTVELKPGVYLLMSWKYIQDDSVLLATKKPFVKNDAPAFPPNGVVKVLYEQMRSRSMDDGHLYLFNAVDDFERLNLPWTPSLLDSTNFQVRDEKIPARSVVHIKLDSLGKLDNENANGAIIRDYTIHHFFGDLIAGKQSLINQSKELKIEVWSPGHQSFPLQVTLVMKNGSGFGKTVMINEDQLTHQIPLKDLGPVPVVLMPRPYPTFLPYYSAVVPSSPLDLNQIESLQISIGPGMKEADLHKPVDIYLKAVWME